MKIYVTNDRGILLRIFEADEVAAMEGVELLAAIKSLVPNSLLHHPPVVVPHPAEDRQEWKRVVLPTAGKEVMTKPVPRSVLKKTAAKKR